MNDSKDLRILFHADASARERLVGAYPGAEIIDIPETGPLPPEVEANVLLTVRYPFPNLAEVLSRGVEWVHILGTGINGFPLELLSDDQVVTCSRGASAVPIAEWCVAVMLAFEKDLPRSWVEEPPETWHWAELGTLAGRRVAILGLGSVGTAVAERLAPFGCDLVALRRTDKAPSVPGVELVSDLHALVDGAEHLVVTVPATPRTVGMVDEAALRRLAPGAHLVVVSRGEIVEEDDLHRVLDDGHLGAASLDTFVEEPLPEGHWMYSHQRVRVSPHISWAAPAALDELYQRFYDNLELWQEGEPVRHVVDRAEAY